MSNDTTAAELARAKTVAFAAVVFAVIAAAVMLVALMIDIGNKNAAQDDYAKALEKRVERLEKQMDDKNKSPIINGILDRVF